MQAESNRQFSPRETNAARARIVAGGESVKAWADRNGFNHWVVAKILGGKRRCIRGQSVEIAQKLGLLESSEGTAVDLPSTTGRTLEAGAPIVACDRSALSQAERAA